MATASTGRVGILWRGEHDARNTPIAANSRLRPLFDALAALDIAAEPVVFGDEWVDDARDQLMRLDGVLVWVDPIMGETNRTVLDALLREVATAGVWVSAHPDVILAMGTKDVVFRTRELGWGGDIYRYQTLEQLAAELPARLAASGPRVLKQHRGNGGIGVWKVELAASASPVGSDTTVRVQDAAPRTTETEEMRLAGFIERCAVYFEGGGRMIDQPFQPRIAEGMIRGYMVRDEVVGFAHQWPDDASLNNILGLPAKKTMYAANEPRFRALRALMESDWIPGLQRLVAVDADSLPLLWDADFLYGPRAADGDDTYVLCEINVSSVSPFPEQAVPKLAQAVADRLASKPRR